jgi:lysophospholipase L1-like esterase
VKLLSSLLSWVALATAVTAGTIVVFGDSTTAPRGTLEVYATLLQRDLSFAGGEVRVVNAGIGGNTTAMAKARFEKDVLAPRPDLVVIQFGLNDSAVDVWKMPPATEPRVALAEYEKNLRGFIAALKAQEARVVLMTPNPLRWTDALKKLYARPPYLPDEVDGMNVKLRDYAETVRRMAREEGVPLVDVATAFEDYGKDPGRKMEDLLPDGMHPNNRGHRLVADLLLKYLPSVDARFALKPAPSPKQSPVP